ncbi:MAG: Hpt domain-containing protein [Marinilabiliaceae bacterium]|nr:Hpt domain-containing protein [Marinilabiliaceae bacterium]
MIEKIRNIFREETAQQLENLENSLKSHLNGEKGKIDVEKIFLAMHSIKGAGPMVGFNSLPKITMPVEKAYDKIRRGELSISDELIQKTNCIVRLIIDALQLNSDLHLADGENEDELINFFKNLYS